MERQNYTLQKIRAKKKKREKPTNNFGIGISTILKRHFKTDSCGVLMGVFVDLQYFGNVSKVNLIDNKGFPYISLNNFEK